MTKVNLVYDCDLKRPACVILQAIHGGDNGTLMRLFPAETWLVHPTPGMQLIAGTPAEWERAAQITKDAVAAGKRA
jgi:hypothetical protein